MHEEEEEEEEEDDHATGRKRRGNKHFYTPGLLNVTSTDLELALQTEDGKIVHFTDGESRSAEGTELPMTAMILRGDTADKPHTPRLILYAKYWISNLTGIPFSYRLRTSKRGVGNTLTPPIKTVSAKESGMKPTLMNADGRFARFSLAVWRITMMMMMMMMMMMRAMRAKVATGSAAEDGRGNGHAHSERRMVDQRPLMSSSTGTVCEASR